MATGLFNLKQVNQAIRQGAWNPSGNTSYAGYFNGSNQKLTLPAMSSLTGNFTVEFFFNDSNVYGGADHTVISNYNATTTASEVLIIQRQSTQWAVYCGTLTGSGNLLWGGTPQNTWCHFALVRSGTTVTAYLNGVSVATATVSTTITLPSGTTIGSYTSSVNYFVGYISNLRITNTAVYTSNFAPPTSNLTAISGTQLLTLQNATIIDNSTNAYTITNVGSVATSVNPVFGPLYKTPAVNYLVVAGGGAGGGCTSGTSGMGGGGAGGLLSGAVQVASGTAYTVTVGAGGTGGTSTGASGANSVFGVISASGGGGGGQFSGNGVSGGSGGGGSGDGVRNPGQGIAGQGNAGGTSTNNSAGGGGGAGTTGINSVGITGPAGNGGVGVASAISGTVSTYAGGGGGAYYSGSSTTTGQGGVGGGGNAGYVGSTNGVSGTANTGGGGGGGCGNSATGTGGSGGSGIVILSYPDIYAPAASTTGSPTVSTSGSGSNYLGGVGNYFQTPANSASTIVGTLSNTANLTIECWIYPTAYNSSANFPGLIGDMQATVENDAWSWGITSTGTLMLYWNVSGTQYRATSSSAVSLNTWTHIALNVSAGAITMYINGVSQTLSGTTTLGTPTSLNNYLVIGQWNNGSGGTGGVSNGLYTGYISNLRVVKASTYTSTFTPSTVPLTAISGTSLLLNTVSGAPFVDASGNNIVLTRAGSVSWNALSPFTTTGYKNRVYTWTSSGSITF